jgi:hypothetical protein
MSSCDPSYVLPVAISRLVAKPFIKFRFSAEKSSSTAMLIQQAKFKPPGLYLVRVYPGASCSSCTY